MYPIVNIPSEAPEAQEPLGTKFKFWYSDHQYLFKAARSNTGEDWAEKVCSEIALRLGLPHAQYDLARWEGARHAEERSGVRSRNFCPDGAALILGNELLSEMDPGYQVGGVSKFHVSAHTVERLVGVLRAKPAQLPLGWSAPHGLNETVQVAIGYLLFDALVGNTDRHDENWGIVLLANGTLHLAPTFDHASSLGCHLRDDNRAYRLGTRDKNRSVEAFAAKGRSALYHSEDDPKPLLTSEAFLSAAQHNRSAGLYWLNVIESLEEREIVAFLEDVPPERISGTAAEFTKRLLLVNKDRLAKLRRELQ